VIAGTNPDDRFHEVAENQCGSLAEDGVYRAPVGTVEFPVSSTSSSIGHGVARFTTPRIEQLCCSRFGLRPILQSARWRGAALPAEDNLSTET